MEYLLAIAIGLSLYFLWVLIRNRQNQEWLPQPTVSPSLRPSSSKEVVGQREAKKIITVMTRKGRLSDHLLLVGPPGTGKTTLARIAAGSAVLHTAIGGQIRTPKDVEEVLLLGSDMLFIDEVHAASRKALEILYTALEDGVIYRRKGHPQRLRADWRFIAGTTDSGKLPGPFRDRFGHTIYLTYYTDADIAKIVGRSANLLELTLRPQQVKDIARRARGVPRVANTLLRRIQDFNGHNGVVANLAEVWQMLGIDEQGLTSLDRQILEILRNSSRPVGLEQLARRTGVDTATISESVEPYLLRRGLIDIRSGGRIAVRKEKR